MSPIAIAKRLATLEDEVAKLKSKLKAFDATKPWWEGIAGTFENNPVYARAMKLGRQYRRSLRPGKPAQKKQ